MGFTQRKLWSLRGTEGQLTPAKRAVLTVTIRCAAPVQISTLVCRVEGHCKALIVAELAKSVQKAVHILRLTMQSRGGERTYLG